MRQALNGVEVQFREIGIRAEVQLPGNVVSQLAEIAHLHLAHIDRRGLIGVSKGLARSLIAELDMQALGREIQRALQRKETLLLAEEGQGQVGSLIRILRERQGLRNEDLR